MALPIVSAARQHPDQIAFDDGSAGITYGELESAMMQSQAMRAADIEPESHIAWCPKNDLESFLNFWSIVRRGAVACPISHRFPESKRRQILDRIDARWLSEMPHADLESVGKSNSHDLKKPATIILSSGSTGVPKVIVHSMSAHIVSAVGAAENMPLHPGDRWAWSLPLCHISGLSILVRCAVAAATVVGIPADSKLTAAMLHERKITHLSVVSTQLRRLLQDERFPSPHLKAVLLGGSSVDPLLVASARNRGVPVHTTYGLTEMASQVTTSTATDDPAKSGRLLPGRLMKICPSGEIIVRGKMLCLGYYEAGKINKVVDEDGWFYTKDIGELDDQQLHVKGRSDNMFISGGENIYPEAIERAMLNSFDIEQVIVVPKDDAAFGARPVAFVKGDLPDDWNAMLRTRLQGFEIPVAILRWPTEADGMIKPDRTLLQKLAQQQ